MHASLLRGLKAAAFACATLLALGAITDARAQDVRARCEERLTQCVSDCGCRAGDLTCLIRCPRYAPCLGQFNECLRAGGENAGALSTPGRGGTAATPAPAAPRGSTAPRTTRSAKTVHTERLEGRIYFLQRGAPEPPKAKYYGYLVVGSRVPPDRKIAVMKGVGCRLDVVTSIEEANKIENLGLVSLPSLRAASGTSTNPYEMINNYDAVRADRWLQSAEDAADESFERDEAILFIGATKPLAGLMDRFELPDPRTDRDVTIADASALSPRYLSRWTYEVVKGVKSGDVASRQDMQSLMEYHSWITTLGSPLAAVMKIAPAQAAAPPKSCL